MTVIADVARALRRARSALFITGAGVSADSGLPTYRGVGGLYDAGETEEGLPIEELLSGPMFRRRPEWTWKYLLQIERACRGARPNPAHVAIAAFESRLERVWTLTQNVDGLHRAAGSTNLIEIHGHVHDLICTRCDHTRRVADYSALRIPPLCPDCGGWIRPDVVLFGELLPVDKVRRMQTELARGFDVVVSVGTSSVFPYIVEPVVAARMRGATTVEINPGETPLSGVVEHKIALGAAAAFEAIAAAAS